MDEGEPWQFWVEMRREGGGEQYVMDALLRRNEERMELSQPVLFSSGGLVITRSRVARLEGETLSAFVGPLGTSDSHCFRLVSALTENCLSFLCSVHFDPPWIPQECR